MRILGQAAALPRIAILGLLAAGALLTSGCSEAPPTTTPNGAPTRVLPSPSSNPAAVTEFWTWFAANADRIARNQSDAAGDISERLKKINRGLQYEIGPRKGGGSTFAVSAGGDTALFGLAQQVAGQAPKLQDWTVVPFRQRHPDLRPVTFRGAVLPPQDLFYDAQPDGNRLVLHLYVRGMSDANRENLTGAAMTMVENAVGEYDTFTVLSMAEVEPLPASTQKLHPIGDLAPAVDAAKTTRPGP